MTNYQEQIDALAERVTALEAKRTATAAQREPQPEDADLFEKLRVWRLERAKADDVQAFQILGNAAIAAISASKPADRYELSKIKGIGEQKLDLYGDDVIAIVRDHMDNW